jgi:hypothetical protein
MIEPLRTFPSPVRIRYANIALLIVFAIIYISTIPPSALISDDALDIDPASEEDLPKIPKVGVSWNSELDRRLPIPYSHTGSDPQTILATGKRPKPKPGKTGLKPPYKAERPPGPPVKDPWLLLSDPGFEFSVDGLVPEMNHPPHDHIREQTPLFIGFTRNWPLLLQCVTSYIAAGWPPEDIYVVENTGVMFANRERRLGFQNPFFMNHTQLSMLGVNVLIVSLHAACELDLANRQIKTPTLFSFAQLQNFYVWYVFSCQFFLFFLFV